MKKFFQSIGIFSFSLVCFFYTKKLIDFRTDDSLIATINEVSDDYYVSAVESIVDGNNFIPGIYGRRVNVNESYSNMKKHGVFDKNLLFFDTIFPHNLLNDNIGKYIVGGNNVRKNIGLVFLLSSGDSISGIVDLLEKSSFSGSFFGTSSWLVENESSISYLVSNNYVVGNLGKDFNYLDSSFSIGDTMIKKYTNKKYGYCFAREENISNLKMCSLNYDFMIKPSIFFNGSLSSIKSIDNGSIIAINVKSVDLSRISFLINYLKGKGFSLVNLDNLLLESFE